VRVIALGNGKQAFVAVLSMSKGDDVRSPYEYENRFIIELILLKRKRTW
jgi:hypothetical protein